VRAGAQKLEVALRRGRLGPTDEEPAERIGGNTVGGVSELDHEWSLRRRKIALPPRPTQGGAVDERTTLSDDEILTTGEIRAEVEDADGDDADTDTDDTDADTDDTDTTDA
jgi:hypothetical protein